MNSYSASDPSVWVAPGDSERVLEDRPLREGVLLSETSCFGDGIWLLSPAQHQLQSVNISLRFGEVPDCYTLIAKQIMLALLKDDIPAGEMSRSISTVRSDFASLKHFLNWLWSRSCGNGGSHTDLASVSADDLKEYQLVLLRDVRDSISRQSYRAMVRRLWIYRRQVRGPSLTFDPRIIGDGWSEAPDSRSSENRTERIPELILVPMLTWSLRFVNEFSTDIIAAVELRRDLHLAKSQPQTSVRESSEIDQALSDLLQEYVKSGRPLPGYEGKVNLSHLSLLLNCNRRSLLTRDWAIDRAVESVGVAVNSVYDIEVSGMLDGVKWIPAVNVGPHGPDSVRGLVRALLGSCYFIIAFLSGMRDSEIKHLRRGCVRVKRGSDGEVYQWRLSSKAFKGEKRVDGVDAEWIVSESVANAIRVLERLQPAGVSLLFSPSDLSNGRAGSANEVISSNGTVRHLQYLADWINQYCLKAGRADVVPAPNGDNWRITTRQFRRTLAWFIARRPGGSLAGSIQFRHHSIQMFEGYAGTSDSGFRAEVEAEEALLRGESLLSMVDRHKHEGLSGPAAGEASVRLESLGARAAFIGAVVNDPVRLRRLMKKSGPEIYPGRFSMCVYNPDKALCRRKVCSDGSIQPTVADCQPLRCRNVALTVDNLEQLKQLYRSYESKIDDQTLPPLIIRDVRRRFAELQVFLRMHGGLE